jgi:hypothetical protein
LPTVRIVQPRNTIFEKIKWFSNMPRGGKRPGSGRKKGGTNKITADVREAIMEAFSILGGAEYLRKVATEDPKAFCALLGKLIPVKVAGDEDNALVLRVAIDRPPDETREQWLARTARERGLPVPTIVGTAARPANGRDDG